MACHGVVSFKLGSFSLCGFMNKELFDLCCVSNLVAVSDLVLVSVCVCHFLGYICC